MKNNGLTNNTKKEGPLSKSQVHKMLKNPFYYGYMHIRGNVQPHRYGPIIDEYLFQKCQDVRMGYNKQPYKYAGKPYAFRALIKCAYCGCTITSDTKKGKYTYLFCTKYKGNCDNTRIREEAIIKQIKKVFKKLVRAC
ncbi:MAG: hypothetical protein GY730_10050 [bacterium]|nr:hypothetical protein [bacterium]